MAILYPIEDLWLSLRNTKAIDRFKLKKAVGQKCLEIGRNLHLTQFEPI